MNWYWKSLCRVLVGDLTYPSKIELVNVPLQSFKQNGEQGGKCSFPEQSFTGAFTTMGYIQSEGRGKQWNKLVLGHFKVKSFFSVPSWRCCNRGILDFCDPCQLLTGEICFSPASRGSSYLTGNWRKIKGQGNELGIRQNYPPAESVTVHFCFPLSELLVFFKIVHLNF